MKENSFLAMPPGHRHCHAFLHFRIHNEYNAILGNEGVPD
jgi:hypothetical protein